MPRYENVEGPVVEGKPRLNGREYGSDYTSF